MALVQEFKMPKAIIVFLLTIIGLCFPQSDYERWRQEQNIPAWIKESFSKSNLNQTYKFNFHLNPFYLRGDFNGDKVLDVCASIINKNNEKTGLAIFHGNTNQIEILGAGNKFANRMDDFSWAGIWKIFEKAKDPIPEDVSGEIIYVEKPEAAGGLIYWNGKQYVWYQWGD